MMGTHKLWSILAYVVVVVCFVLLVWIFFNVTAELEERNKSNVETCNNASGEYGGLKDYFVICNFFDSDGKLLREEKYKRD